MGAQFPLMLCVLAYLLHEATMARLPRVQNPKVTAPMIPEDDADQLYTVYGTHECKKCPPGTFVSEPCTVARTEGTCQPCDNNTFSKLSNSFDSCFGCRACRILDEVETKRCTATTNTECTCKNGTFCSPGQPCETCTNCKTSCGPGEKKVQDCTPTSDIQCLPDTTSSPPTSSPGQGDPGLVWFIVVAVVLLAAVVLGVVLCWRRTTNLRKACTDFWICKRTQFHQYLQRKSSPEPSEERDNMLSVEVNPPSCSTANGQAPERMIPLRAPPPEEERREPAEMRKLVPRNCKNSAETLCQSFDIFISKVPSKYWKRFMRLLKLTDNEIVSAEKSSPFLNEQCYQMLRTWLDKNGQAATLSALLDALNSMHLKGIVEDVTSALIDQCLYVYEE